MLDRLAEIETKYEDLAEQINDPDVIANQTEWRKDVYKRQRHDGVML